MSHYLVTAKVKPGLTMQAERNTKRLGLRLGLKHQSYTTAEHAARELSKHSDIDFVVVTHVMESNAGVFRNGNKC